MARRAGWIARVAVPAAGLFVAACAGEGSDIGPRLPRIPDASSKVVVLDDQGRGVVGATVTIDGTQLLARTGRNGRGDFLADPRGRVVVQVDGAAAAATAGDTLATLRVATTVTGPDLPSPVYLPDLPAAASAALPAGTQSATTAITSTGGAVVTVPAGTSVGAPGAGATIDLRLGELQPQHLPGDPPLPGIGARLFGRGVFVHPADATFTPGIDLDAPDDLAVDGDVAQLFHLDPVTGEWSAIASATGAGGRIAALGQLTRGGLYAWGADVAETTVTGRVVDTAMRTVPDVMVRVDQRAAVTGGDGRFTVNGVAARLADGSGRAAAIELFAGGSWLPWRQTATIPVAPGTVDVGDLTLDTLPAGNVRVQQVVRARADALQPARLSSLLGEVALFVTSDANGQAFFEDVPSDFFGFQEGRRRSSEEVLYGQSVAFLPAGTRWLDSFQFLFQRPWFLGTRAARAFVCDAIGGGPLREADVVQGATDGQGLVGTTRENGTLFADRGFGQRATASLRSERGGRSVTHAWSISLPNSDHLEFPLQRVLRTPLGAFDRHGLVAGSLIGADPAREHALTATRRITRQEWWDEVVEDRPIPSSLPLDVDPAGTHGPFRVGLPVAGGHVAAVEFLGPVGAATLEKVGLLADFVPAEGVVTARDVPLAFAATQAFDVTGALAGLDPLVDLASLEFALALAQDGDRVVDVARGLVGNLSASGDDLSFLLPPLTGALAGRRWLAVVEGSLAIDGGTFAHANLLSLPAAPGFAFQSFPNVTAPAPGATVSAAGFEVAFVLPPGAVFATVQLRSETAGELLLWDAVVRPFETGFRFPALPTEAETPLVAGRTYTLTVSAWFGDASIASPDPYGDLVAFAQSIAAIEAGLTQVTRRSFQITAN